MSANQSHPADDCLLVFTNFPDLETARQIGTALVENQTAACVNLLSPMESIYRWQGKVELATEIPALIKTTRGAFDKLRSALAEAHPYEVPEIVAVPIADGLPAYLDWVRENAP